MPNSQLAEVALPCMILFGMAVFCFKMGLDALRADPQKHSEVRRRAGSAKNVALGLVEPRDGDPGGMAVRRSADGKIVIVRTSQLSNDDIS